MSTIVSRRMFLDRACMAGAALALGSSCNLRTKGIGEGSVSAKGKPNVIWIVLDACRASNLTPYGYKRNTSPHIDRLAERGVLFKRHYAQAPHTYYSVPSYITGRYFPSMYLHVEDPFDMWRTPPSDEKLISTVLKENGYNTCLISAHARIPTFSRFAQSFDESAYFAPVAGVYSHLDVLAERALNFIDRQNEEAPFFVYLHSMDTHWPHSHIFYTLFSRWCDKNYPMKEVANQLSLLKNYSRKDQNFIRGLYDGDILYSDAVIGRFFERLEQRNVLENTIVIVGSDHGEALGEDGVTAGHPNDLYTEEVLHVPLVIAGPGIPEGLRVNALTENVDIFPTLVDWLGLDSTANVDGRSMASLVKDPEAPAIHEYSFAKKKDDGDDFTVVLTTAKEKYATNYDFKGELLFDVPDFLASRKKRVKDSSEAIDKMRSIVRTDILGLWNAFRELPLSSPVSFGMRFQPDLASSREAFVERTKVGAQENKWTLAWGKLISSPWNKNAPPITFNFHVPNARYGVFLTIRATQDHWGHPASAFLYKCQEDAEFSRVVATLPNTKSSFYQDVLLGEYTVSSENFQLTLDEADMNYWAWAKKVLFVPLSAGKDSLSTKDRDSLQDELEALGYLE